MAVAARFGGVIDYGLVALFGDSPGLRMLASGVELARLEATVAELGPHVVVLGEAHVGDVALFGRLREVRPGVGLVVLGQHLSSSRGMQLLALGANACVSQEASPDQLVAAMRVADEGGRMLFALDDGRPDAQQGLLTPREAQVLALLREGCTNGQIATALTISVETVRKHVQRVNRKLGIKSRRQLHTLNASVRS